MADPTAWMVDNSFADFVLMPNMSVTFMCMVGYAFFGGVKVFSTSPASSTVAFKFVNLIMTCTGGGILVPIFINGIPVPLANDYFIIAMMIAFAIHHYFPVLREVYKISPIVKVWIVICFETFRSSVVFKLTTLAATKIPASVMSFPLFGPIACGAIGGCGGAFLPLNKGLEPIKNGLASPMFTAMVGATVIHLFLNTPLSDGCVDAEKKVKVHLAGYFIAVGLLNAFGCYAPPAKKA